MALPWRCRPPEPWVDRCPDRLDFYCRFSHPSPRGLMSDEPVQPSQDTTESRYRTLFEHAPIGILYADAESYYLDANDTMCRMLGYTREQLIGKHASDIVAPI